EGLELARLERPQEHRLSGQMQIANLVQKNHAAIGFLEGATPVGDRSREASLRVTEQLADREVPILVLRAVDRDVRPSLGRAQQINGLGQPFLADAAFTSNQHRLTVAGRFEELRLQIEQ